MYFRSILSGTLAAMFLSVVAAEARDVAAADHGISVQHPASGLPGVFDAAPAERGYQVAQAADPRVGALEEQIRKLNGTIEDLNYQVIQLQEQIRKMQEDNEFRFQELEKKSDARAGGGNRAVAGGTTAPATEDKPAGDSVEGVIANDTTNATGSGLGASEKTFGTITVDKNGNVRSVDPGAGANPAAPSAGAPAGKENGSVVAALPPTDDPEELYRNSYQFILSGDYATAETGFRNHIERFPQNERTADAQFWLGEALLGQKKYRDAAETFLAASKAYPKAKKAPDMLLKLGVSMVGLNQREVACATFSEVGKRYPNISSALKERVKQEQALAAC
ncbi:tol-pal system protein YbgF [Mesorhizobium sp. LHD-90]|uniref:tol-pal system protein YbgF n=1 Tax=Mesorhizobium sp. LHD-90 TaxID=3071414 RepID=UPI0027E1B09C|nr:tol-pal system protein YbgF [Mesorhizobium sp. LHD-90]MDQ6437017.1 tol-pal system protein YbgF [Mesorhizobium sp. LHD-90]